MSKHFEDIPDVLSVPQTSEMLGLSTKTIRMMLSCGQIPGRKAPGRNRWLIPKAALIAWLNEGKDVA